MENAKNVARLVHDVLHIKYIYNENHSAKESRHPDTIPVSSKENRFTKQFQQADSVFNEKLNQIE